MKTAKEWLDYADPAWSDEYGQRPDLTEEIIVQIQKDALRHAALRVHTMSRGTKSEQRSIAIDEAVEILTEESNRDRAV